MKQVPALKAKTKLGKYLSACQKCPIQITKYERPVAVLISVREYERLVKLEDLYWGEKALAVLEQEKGE